MQNFAAEKRTIFAMWHNMIGLGLIIKYNERTQMLASSHTDGRIISGLLSRFGYRIIEGSTNRAPIAATRQIIRALKGEDNIFITPDGPRGPVYKINSNLIGISKIAGAKILPLSFTATNFFRLKTWDGLIMPLPFGSITFKVGDPLILSDNDEVSSLELEAKLKELME